MLFFLFLTQNRVWEKLDFLKFSRKILLIEVQTTLGLAAEKTKY